MSRRLVSRLRVGRMVNRKRGLWLREAGGRLVRPRPRAAGTSLERAASTRMWTLPVAVGVLLLMASLLAASEPHCSRWSGWSAPARRAVRRAATAVEPVARRPLESLNHNYRAERSCNVFAECLATSFLLHAVGAWGGYLAVPVLSADLLIAEITQNLCPAHRWGGEAHRPAAGALTNSASSGAAIQPFESAASEPVSKPGSRPAQAGEHQGSRGGERERSIRCSTWWAAGGQVMTPRDVIFSLPIDTRPSTGDRGGARPFLARSIYQGDPNHIVGILHAKDVAARRLDRTPTRIERLMRPPYFVPPGKLLGALLDEMRHNHQQISMVVDEYGKLLGLVSLEDLLEELFGELKDEFDVEVPEMTALPEGAWSVAGSIELRKLGEVLGTHHLPLGAIAEPTLNRLVLRKLGRVPRAGERFQLGAST